MKTIDFKGNPYAQVKERLKQFRTDCPNGLIDTVPTIDGDSILFKARILKDKSDPASAEATGHALGPNKGDKNFEKLETIAVGRALALLGYASDGEIASGEEMEEFLQFKEGLKEKTLSEHKAKLEAVKSMEELQKVWANLPPAARSDKTFGDIKDAMKAKFTPQTANANS